MSTLDKYRNIGTIELLAAYVKNQSDCDDDIAYSIAYSIMDTVDDAIDDRLEYYE